jgi:hypothetical protein
MTPPFWTSITPDRRAAIGGGTHPDAVSPQAGGYSLDWAL